jgi:ceramide synthetase
MASSPHVFSTVEIFAGRVVPHGYYKMIHRDSWFGDSAFYLRMLGFAVFFTFLRLAVARWVVKPLGKPLNLKASNYTKLEEAIMQVGFYTWGWSYNAAYLFKQDWFWNPIVSFLDNFPRQANEYEISFYYSLQIGWYLHGVYTHFFLDTKKSDFAIMIVHHVVTLSLLYGAYVVGYFRVGMLVMFSMDVCDTFLYSAKILKIVKSGGKVDYPAAVYYIGFGMIPVTWFFFRLVYFPFVVMRTTAIDAFIASGYDNADGWAPFNILLLILLCLNTWWFSIIVKIMWRSITSQSLQALDDIREKEAAELLAKKEANAGGEKHTTHQKRASSEQNAKKTPKKNQ